MPRVSRFYGQMPLETTFLFIFDDKLFISLSLSRALAPKPGHHVGWKERNGFLKCSSSCPRGADSKLRGGILTKVRVNRDPKKQVTTTPSTNNSRRLDQMCGNSSSTAVITPSKPAN